MTWLLPKQLCDCSACAAGQPCLIRASTQRCTSTGCAHKWSVTASGKPTQRTCLWTGWKHRPWSQRLFSRATSATSTGLSGWVESMDSSAGYPVNRFPKLASEKGPATVDGFGRRYGRQCAEWERGSWRSRTSQLSLLPDLTHCSATLPKTGGLRNGAVYERQTLARHTSETGGFSSRWPTASATDYKGSSRPGQRRGQLSEAAEQTWATPQARDHHGPPGDSFNMKSLPRQVCKWPTSTDAASSHPDQQTEKPGARSRRVLNPRFVEWLMGWPLDWTSPDATACEPAAMASYRSKLLSLTLNCWKG